LISVSIVIVMRICISYFNNLRRDDDRVCVGQFFKFDRLFRGEFRACVNLELYTP